MSGYTLAWVAWGAAFAVIEGKALADNRRNDTLSEHVWQIFAVRDRNAPYGQLRRAILVMGMAWLAGHFITGGWV